MQQFSVTWQEKGKTRVTVVEARTAGEAIEKLKASRPRAKHVRSAGAMVAGAVPVGASK